MYRIIILSPFLSVWYASSLSCHLKMAVSLCPHVISSCDTSLPFATCHLVFCSTLMPGLHSTSHEANTTHLLYIHHYNDFWRLLSSGIWPHVVWYVGTPLGGIFSSKDGSSSSRQEHLYLRTSLHSIILQGDRSLVTALRTSDLT